MSDTRLSRSQIRAQNDPFLISKMTSSCCKRVPIRVKDELAKTYARHSFHAHTSFKVVARFSLQLGRLRQETGM